MRLISSLLVYGRQKVHSDHLKDIWMKLKEPLNLEGDKDAVRYFQYFTMKDIEKNSDTGIYLIVENRKVDVTLI